MTINKKSFFLLLLILPFKSYCDYWTQKASFPGQNRAMATAVHIGTTAYAGCGGTTIAQYNDWWKYDKPSNTWTQMADLPGAIRADAFGFAIGNAAFVIGGINASGLLKEVWKYDAPNNTWTQKNDFPGSFRSGAKGFVIGNTAYMGSGQTDLIPTYTNDFWKYESTTDTWTQKNNLPGPARTEALGMAIDSIGYFGLGLTTGGILQNDFWKYDTLNDIWTAQPNFPGVPRFALSRFSISNMGYVGAGYNSTTLTVSNDWWQFDPVAQQWNQKTAFPGFPGAAISFSINNKGYLGLSTNGSGTYANLFWEYSTDSLTGIPYPSIISEPVVKIFPHPLISKSTFEINNSIEIKDLQLEIYDGENHTVNKLKIINRHTVVEKGNLSSGIYFYRLTRLHDHSEIAKGKFLVE